MSIQDLETLKDLIKTTELQLIALKKLYQEHPGHLEVRKLEAQRRRGELLLPKTLEKEWECLTDIRMGSYYVEPWHDISGCGGGDYEWKVTLVISNKEYVFDGDRHNCYGVVLPSGNFETVSQLWNYAKQANRGEIYRSMASVIAYAIITRSHLQRTPYRLPWDLKSALCYKLDDK